VFFHDGNSSGRILHRSPLDEIFKWDVALPVDADVELEKLGGFAGHDVAGE
jgi:hypothetical protein